MVLIDLVDVTHLAATQERAVPAAYCPPCNDPDIIQQTALLKTSARITHRGKRGALFAPSIPFVKMKSRVSGWPSLVWQISPGKYHLATTLARSEVFSQVAPLRLRFSFKKAEMPTV
jgi:hypothetical protein